MCTTVTNVKPSCGAAPHPCTQLHCFGRISMISMVLYKKVRLTASASLAQRCLMAYETSVLTAWGCLPLQTCPAVSVWPLCFVHWDTGMPTSQRMCQRCPHMCQTACCSTITFTFPPAFRHTGLVITCYHNNGAECW